jgi:Clp amino terminal domain, pathogenicity island component
VVYLAIEDASARGHDCVGVEHVLLGLLGAEDGVGSRVLHSLGVTDERVRARLSETVPPSAQGRPPPGPFPLPFAPRASEVLELALREALSYGSRFVGTEHILLGMVRQHEGVAVEVLREFGVDAAKIRDAVPAPPPASRIVVREDSGGPPGVPVSRIRGNDRPERGDRAGVEQDIGEQQRRVGLRRSISGLVPAAGDPCVTCVHATVNLQSSVSAEVAGALTDDRGAARRVVQIVSEDAESLSLHISLSAEDSTGRRIHTSGPDFGISGPRRGIWHRWHGPPLPDDAERADRIMLFDHRVDLHDIEDGINQMLGRDPSLHRPPRLAWQNLIRALEQAGVQVTEPELIDAPLSVELTPEVQAELQRAT